MKNVTIRISMVLAGMLLSIGTVPPSVADDTELFNAPLDPSVEGARPNIMFIIDTSGSMATQIEAEEPYDPNKTYDGCYGAGRIYGTSNTGKPSCNSAAWVNKSALVCDRALSAMNSGPYGDYFAHWDEGDAEWVIASRNYPDRPMECYGDRGRHGLTDGSSEVYAADGQQYSASRDDEVSWGSFNGFYAWDSNWLNWWVTEQASQPTRLQVVKDVTKNLIDNIEGVNISLMRFNRNNDSDEGGGPVLHAMENVVTSRPELRDKIDALPASGWTPLSETLYEANQYFSGWSVHWGDMWSPKSVPESRVGNSYDSDTYKRPDTWPCYKNYIVLLTDGAPTRDTDSENAIENLPDFDTLVGNQCDVENENNANGQCLDDLAAYMFKRDFDPDTDGKQNITTYTVGFTVDLPILAETAERGGGEYFLADDADTLATSLTDIVKLIKDDGTTFSAPVVPVNAFNRIQNLNDVFVSVFAPTSRLHWFGNMKKYGFQDGQLVDQNGEPAVNQGSGFFDEDAQSFWSENVDGYQVPSGGAAHEIPHPDDRKLYAAFGPGLITNESSNRVHENNDNLTASKLGVPLGVDLASRYLTIKHMQGYEVDLDNLTVIGQSYKVGDPLHVQPVPVIYGGSADAPEAVVYYTTNDGYFHAVDPETGVEKWAFIPDRLLDRMYSLMIDPVVFNKGYGLDGEITAAILNNDFVPGISGDEQVILVFGMRRGGDAIFAVDVTDPDAPALLWEKDSGDAGYDTLGQTWSKPQYAKLDIGGSKKDVVIFGGGYDPDQDGAGYGTDDVGNDLYIVDIKTGNVLWRASANLNVHAANPPTNRGMEHSIPAAVNVIDLTGDGLANRMYVGDMGGRLWRFDIRNGETGNDLVTGGVIATLGAADLESPANADLRRFYATPDAVAVLGNHEYAEPYLAINLGSGYRAHPLNTDIDEWFFSVRDYQPFAVMDTEDYPAEPVTIGDLEDITATATPTMPYGAAGWKLQLNISGEKVLTESFTFRGTTFFVSFAPEESQGLCEAGYGNNYLYRVNVTDGAPNPHPDDLPEPPATPEPDDRYVLLDQQGIAPSPTMFFPDPGQGQCVGDECDDPAVCVGLECEDSGIGNAYTRSFWFQDETQ